ENIRSPQADITIEPLQKPVRITKIMLNSIINEIKINMLRQWPATFPLQQPVMEALETESSHEFVMP
ncbi:hypothetical protein, partial [Raoultella ornithinolytica]|uniref:hypothetical protein n=1 Tax=Raoultella ornithinolytica TaxID=54291 RepID=UPI001F3C2BD0